MVSRATAAVPMTNTHTQTETHRNTHTQLSSVGGRVGGSKNSDWPSAALYFSLYQRERGKREDKKKG